MEKHILAILEMLNGYRLNHRSHLPNQGADPCPGRKRHPFDDQPIRINHPKELFVLTGCPSCGPVFSRAGGPARVCARRRWQPGVECPHRRLPRVSLPCSNNLALFGVSSLRALPAEATSFGALEVLGPAPYRIRNTKDNRPLRYRLAQSSTFSSLCGAVRRHE